MNRGRPKKSADEKFRSYGGKMPPDLYERLEAHAKAEHRSVSAQIALIIEQYLDLREPGTLAKADGFATSRRTRNG